MGNEHVIPTPAPSDLPTYTIRVAGKELSPEYQVLSVSVVKGANRISSARIVLLDGDAAAGTFPASGGSDFIPGRSVEIAAGYHSKESTIFTGIIVRHGIRARGGTSSTLVVDCRHQAARLTAGRKSGVYLDAADSDVFATIIDRYSIGKDLQATAVKHRELVQYRCSDWDFVVSRAEANGMLVFTNGDKIEIKKPDFGASAALTLTYGSTLLEVDAEIDARDQLKGVKGRSWDASAQQPVESAGSEPAAPRQGDLKPADLAGAIGSDDLTIDHCGAVSEQELKSMAEAYLVKSRGAKVRGRVRFIGYAGLDPGQVVELKGLGDRMNGNAYLTGIRHEIGRGGWTTDAQFGLSPEWFMGGSGVTEPGAAGFLPAPSGLQIGIVQQLKDDPEGEDRVLVTLPLVNPDDGVWARVATLDAGEERGSFFRPEIGDEVVLGFLNQDPRYPVILGMLNSSAKPAPMKGDDNNHEKGFVTRSKMKLLFNDEKSIVTISTPAGKKIVIDDDAGTIEIADENDNRLLMGSDGISLESAGAISLKAGGDCTVKGSNVSLKADQGVELNAGGTATLKGSMVQVN